MYDRDELRVGREKVIEASKITRDYYERVTETVGSALNLLRQFV